MIIYAAFEISAHGIKVESFEELSKIRSEIEDLIESVFTRYQGMGLAVNVYITESAASEDGVTTEGPLTRYPDFQR